MRKATLFGILLISVGISLAGGRLAPVTGQTSDTLVLKEFDASTNWDRFGKLFAPYGVRAGRSVVAEPSGQLVFQLGSQKDAGHVGMKAKAALADNFLIEVKYQIEAIPKSVDTGYGVGVGLSAGVDHSVGGGGASVTRGTYKGHGQRYIAGRDIPQGAGKVHYASRAFPSESQHGRLALRRVSRGEIQMLAADTPDGELVELQRYPFPEKPVQTVLLFADTGGATAELKAKFYDLRVLSGSAVSTTEAAKGPTGVTVLAMPPPASAANSATETTEVPIQSTKARSMWWLPILTFVIGLVLGLNLRGWKRPSGHAKSQPARMQEA